MALMLQLLLNVTCNNESGLRAGYFMVRQFKFGDTCPNCNEPFVLGNVFPCCNYWQVGSVEDAPLNFRLENCSECGQLFSHTLLNWGMCEACLKKRNREFGVQPEDDQVNHPKHYHEGPYEVIKVLEGWGLINDFCLGNAIKYIARARHKGKFTEDLKKAIWYLEYAIGERK